ncbi:hypothetical protein MKW98_022272 [Papaver atlanticum]|uniref:PRA1 family protein n=1 Tax=Papaver atlanticum TaxID=357466 RepID=A0AAD4XS27_9MAGN|nr:hypothetical protein MKW98_022272 [Papaver atlanticum]
MAASVYTTIPISSSEMISRSFHNLSVFLSVRRRPWSEFIATDVFDKPESFDTALVRIKKNSEYFRLNYGLLVLACALASLITTPVSLLLVAGILGLWLLLYVFREDPVFMFGDQPVNDRLVLMGLVIISLLTIVFTEVFRTSMFGLGIGIIISAIHGAFRNPDGLFLNEDEAASTGFIGRGGPKFPSPSS